MLRCSRRRVQRAMKVSQMKTFLTYMLGQRKFTKCAKNTRPLFEATNNDLADIALQNTNHRQISVFETGDSPGASFPGAVREGENITEIPRLSSTRLHLQTIASIGVRMPATD